MIKKINESFDKQLKDISKEKVNLTLESLAELNDEEHNEEVIKDEFFIGPRKYSIEVYPDKKSGCVARWEDNSDNGFGYNNKGSVYVSENAYKIAMHDKGYADLEDYISVTSDFERSLRPEVKREMIKKALQLRGEGPSEDSEENLTEDLAFKEKEYNKMFRYSDINNAPWFKDIVKKAVKNSDRSGNRIYMYFGSEEDALEAIHKLSERNINHIDIPMKDNYNNTFRVDMFYNFKEGRPSKENKNKELILESLDENTRKEVEVELEDILKRNPEKHGFDADTEEVKYYVVKLLKDKGYKTETSGNDLYKPNKYHVEYWKEEKVEESVESRKWYVYMDSPYASAERIGSADTKEEAEAIKAKKDAEWKPGYLWNTYISDKEIEETNLGWD